MRLPPEKKSKIDALWDKFWSGGLSNPLQSIEQMSYLIFMKRLEDMDVLEQRRANAIGKTYSSIFEGNEECRWSEWKHKSAEDMLKHVRDVVFPFIKNIHDGEKTLFSQHMKDAVFIIPKPSLVQEAVGIIDELDISGQTSDMQGDIYEYLLSQLATAGKNGQFRTPRHIIRMIVELVDPDVNDKICDPACGTAGFLFTAYRYILRKYTSPDMVLEDEEGDWHNLYGDRITEQEAWEKLNNFTFYGFDFDSTMVRIALMNMVLHGIRAPHIEAIDTLSNQYSGEEKFTVILANPPFKGSIDKNDINDKLALGTTKTELLFVKKCTGCLRLAESAELSYLMGCFSEAQMHTKNSESFFLKNASLKELFLCLQEFLSLMQEFRQQYLSSQKVEIRKKSGSTIWRQMAILWMIKGIHWTEKGIFRILLKDSENAGKKSLWIGKENASMSRQKKLKQIITIFRYPDIKK
jgi:hypothetical protein